MVHPNKRRGDRFERKIVELAEKFGLETERARGSDGRALNEHKECDALIEGRRVQCKKRSSFPQWTQIPHEVDEVILGSGPGDARVLMDIDVYFELLEIARNVQANKSGQPKRGD